MKLIEALQTLNGAARRGGPVELAQLVCGFTPLHLQTFFAAHLQRRFAGHRVECHSGVFGDIVGNLERCAEASAASTAVALEWSDLDPRLGLRAAGGWSPSSYPDVLGTASLMLRRIEQGIEAVAARARVAVSLPTLPLLPISFSPSAQASSFELSLRALLAESAARIAKAPSVRVVGAQRLDELSPVGRRHDGESDLATGFPYLIEHASALGMTLAELLAPTPPKKGLVVDLDDTLWRGIVGEVGPGAVSWSLEHHSHEHALLQQMLAALADAGVLIGISSKNDPTIAAAALERDDMILRKAQVFPAIINWHAKSEAIATILATWNIAAESTVFIDDSPTELAQVHTRYPELTCLLFPKDDAAAVIALLWQLRDLFGKSELHQEDQLRLESIRSAAGAREDRERSADNIDEFLAQSDSRLTLNFVKDARNPRAFELLNKTNQFNLNGRRVSDAEWRALLESGDSVVATIAYRDKYGPLGLIAVVSGAVSGSSMTIQHWVMSCRAFARRIEHETLRALFEHSGVEEIIFDYAPTERNGPITDFLTEFVDMTESGRQVRLTRAGFSSRCKPTYHRVDVSASEVGEHG